VEAILAEIVPQIHFGGVETVRLALRNHIRGCINTEINECIELLDCHGDNKLAIVLLKDRFNTLARVWTRVEESGATTPSEVV